MKIKFLKKSFIVNFIHTTSLTLDIQKRYKTAQEIYFKMFKKVDMFLAADLEGCYGNQPGCLSSTQKVKFS